MFSNEQFLIAFAKAAELINDNVTTLDEAKRKEVRLQIMSADAAEITDYLQVLWDNGNVPDVPPLPQTLLSNGTNFSVAVLDKDSAKGPAAWYHLIYAYLIENTRLYELVGRVIRSFTNGESLGVASSESQRWLGTTEALFYRQQSAHDHTAFTTLTSDSRADGRSIRRNAYFRMFGMELNHGTDNNQPYPYTKPKLANSEFVTTFEALLRELWIAIINQDTTTPNPTDNGAVVDHTRQLRVMLNNRRINGTLSREEFSAVATLDWLRMAVSFNSPIVKDLRSEAASEAERIFKVAERVGLPANSKSDDYLRLAVPTTVFLRSIELGIFTNADSYINNPASRQVINDIITHWSSATGKVMKLRTQPVVNSSAA
jgi:hypothetical protein